MEQAIDKQTLQDTIDAMVTYGDPYKSALSDFNKQWPVSHQEDRRIRKYSEPVPLDQNLLAKEASAKAQEKKAHEYWYYFSKCSPEPHQIPPGTTPRAPFMRFDTKEECQSHINSLKSEVYASH